MNKILIASLSAIVIVGGIVALTSQSKSEDTKSRPEQSTKTNVTNTGNTLSEDANPEVIAKQSDEQKMGTKPDSTIKPTAQPTEMVKAEGEYLDYSAQALAGEQKEGHKIVLFFHAAWCPSCKAADLAFRTQSSQIPAGVAVLKTDYDTNKELKQKYGVTYQHTFVQIDAQGNQITKWNGGDIDNLKKYIK